MAGTVKNQIREVESCKQLFLDHTLVERSEGVRLVMNSPYQTGDLIVAPDQAWETMAGARIGHCSSVIRENGKFRLWYDYVYGEQRFGAQGRKARSMAYAESEDGIHFTKPLFDWNPMFGSEKTNILIAESRGGDVWKDPTAPPEKKYRHQCKYAFVVPGAKLEFFASPDGIKWEKTHVVDIGECDTANIAFWDDRYHRYVLYTRKWIRSDQNAADRYRQVRRFESDDLVHWENETVVWTADEADLGKFKTPTGQPCMDYYGATVYRYPEAGDFYILLSPAFWHWKRRPENERWGFSGDPQDTRLKQEHLAPASMDVRLGFSRDGVRFHHAVDRSPFLHQGPEGRFDSKMVWALPNPVAVGEELWIYYSGGNRDHDGCIDPASSRQLSGISRAIMRLDGFVSADADYTGGFLETPLLSFKGIELRLNVNTGGGGSILVELLDETKKPISGYTRDDAVVINGNSTKKAVKWNDGRGVEQLQGRPVHIRFLMQDTKLFAFQFT